jgi:DNA-binding GntR family transcriptional regulator
MQKESLVDIAHRELQKRFISLELPPGSIWKEADLAELVNVGRTPVREAIQRMASDQLVTVLRRTGIMISATSVQDQLYVLEARRVLELVVSVRAAKYALKSEREQLNKMAAAIETAGTRHDVMAYLDNILETKIFVAQVARNPYAARALAPLHTFSQRFYYMHYMEFNNLEEVGRVHARLSRAIAAGDLIETEKASHQVVDTAESFTRDLLMDQL